jgi:hypothetical protein
MVASCWDLVTSLLPASGSGPAAPLPRSFLTLSCGLLWSCRFRFAYLLFQEASRDCPVSCAPHVPPLCVPCWELSHLSGVLLPQQLLSPDRSHCHSIETVCLSHHGLQAWLTGMLVLKCILTNFPLNNTRRGEGLGPCTPLSNSWPHTAVSLRP